MKTLCQWLVMLAVLFGPLAVQAQLRPAVLDTPALDGIGSDRSAILGLARAGSRLVAVGARGVVLLSDDEGRHWRQARVPVSSSLTAVQFVDAEHGWAVGHLGVVLYSEDGGQTWSRQLDGQQLAQLALRAAQAEGSAQRVQEAERLVADGPDKPWLDLYFQDRQNGFVIGAYNLILRTRDGGRSWAPWMGHLDNPEGLHLYAMRAADGALFIAGERGLLLRSRDDGESFQALASPYAGSFFGLLAQGQQVLAFGLRGNAWRSLDQGEHWQALASPVQASLVAGLTANDGQALLLSQEGELLRVEGAQLVSAGRLPGGAFASLLQAADGRLIGGGLGGLQRYPNDPALAGAQSQ